MATTEFKGETVSRDAVLRALRHFDQDHPDTNSYENWLDKGYYKYALVYGGKRYPCKFILSEASGLPVRSFSGGEETNRIFRELGFEVAAK
jgi:hypothetical protein